MGDPQPDSSAAFRALPSVERLLGAASFEPLRTRFGRELVLDAVRADLDGLRASIRAGETCDLAARASDAACAERVERALTRRLAPRYPRAINATGVVLHTGLGRAPLAEEARQALLSAAGACVLEVDADSGRRSQRDRGITELVRELTGAEAACVVNNNAGATLITLAALAAGRPVIVSRGQLVEIGGSYRIPDVMAQSGAQMVEVGTTNRTHLRDYERALDEHPETALLLRVHTSNFRVEGFTKEVELAELTELAARRGVQVMDDLGSGCLIDLSPFGLPREPVIAESLAAGAGVVTFSGDKLLGGPQAGVIVGSEALVSRVRSHSLYRALRPDKLTLAALEASLSLFRDPARALERIPTLEMLARPLEQLERQARALANRLESVAGLEVACVETTSKVGGGSYAVEELPTWAVTLRAEGRTAAGLAQALRLAEPSVWSRVAEERVWLDVRTLREGEAEELAGLVRLNLNLNLS